MLTTVAKEGGDATAKCIPTHVSWSVRSKRQLEKVGADCAQTHLTGYLKVLNDVEACMEGLLLEKKYHLCYNSMLTLNRVPVATHYKQETSITDHTQQLGMCLICLGSEKKE